jgi:hypothetical protein
MILKNVLYDKVRWIQGHIMAQKAGNIEQKTYFYSVLNK